MLAGSVFAGSVFALLAKPQNWVSVGMKGGVPLPELFAERTFSYVVLTIQNPFGLAPFTESQTTRTSGGSRSFVLGPMIEVQFPLELAFEADALYRPLNVNTVQTTFTHLTSGSQIPLEFQPSFECGGISTNLASRFIYESAACQVNILSYVLAELR